MDKFIVSARKYRPQNFSTVVGQEHITTTLKNAIRNKQLAHAFLFCGPRGVGKTTCARILAKTINCENLSPEGEACNSCPSCVSFNNGGSLNIHELDAASNNSVDDIRSLVEQVRFAPQAGKYKVYIIDEVHMLSASAFNAFLKTLEEPPSYAIFILATTEKHKILPTILSRCQIFDFKRITTNDTVEHLREITGKEEIKAEKAALQVIAQKSEGCLRDALSILDKIVSFTNGIVTYQNTLEHLNILDDEYYFKLMQAMLDQDLAKTMLLFEDINNKGFEGDLVVNSFMEFLRNLLVCQDAKVAGLLDVVESFKDQYKSMAKKVPLAYLLSSLNILNETEINFRNARNKRLHVELALIKLCYLQQAIEISGQETGIGKKKLIESVTALAYRSIPYVEIKKPVAVPNNKQEDLPQFKKAATPLTVAEPGAKLLIQEPVNIKEMPAAELQVYPETAFRNHDSSATVVSEQLVSKTKTTSPKLGALSKIRQQFSNGNSNTASVLVKPLELDELYTSWNKFTSLLKEARNPAAQSFERASLKVVDNNLFEVIIGNNLEQKFIEQQRLPLCEHLQEWFSNKALSYSLVINEENGTKEIFNMPLNSREQYQQLIASYPLVKELKERLKLELDY